ncbi:MAG: penicillin-binding protein activator [Paracoccaceae bacterium]
MFSVFHSARKSLAKIALILSASLLIACEPTSFSGSGPSINTGEPIPVALLVPGGSGNAGDEVLARSLENAARLAMADLGGVEIDLRVYNTAGSADVAASMASKAVSEGAKIIIGPVFAESANAVGRAVASKGVNVLAFSNNTAIAGGNVFVLGQTFQNTADRLSRYAISQGKSNIMIIYGQDGSEESGRTAINRAVGLNGGVVAAEASFELSQQGVIDAIPQITSEAKSSGAQAVFLTSGTSGALPFLAQLLPENGLGPDQIQYLGLQRWDIPASALTLPGIQGGWFAKPDPLAEANFQSRYFTAYGTSPHLLAALAYDGIAAIGALASSGGSDALSRASLTQPSGFAGVSGVFRLLSDGTNERGLAIAQVQNSQVIVIDPAPRSFAASGF